MFYLDTTVGSCLMEMVEDSWLWHKRLCHVNFDSIVKVSKMKSIRGMPNTMKPENAMYKECQLGKLTKSSFSRKYYSSENVLDLVHTYLCGPMRTKSFYGDWYFMLFVDDTSRMMWVVFLKEKFEAFHMFKVFKAPVERGTSKSLKYLRLDRGGELTSQEFINYFEE